MYFIPNTHSSRFVNLDSFLQKDIGWRPEAKRLLLVMTDQPSHLALDSKLAGIVVPHDGRCHLEDNIYTQTTTMVRKTTALDTHKTPDAKLVLVQMMQVQFWPVTCPKPVPSLDFLKKFLHFFTVSVHKRGKDYLCSTYVCL